MKILNLLPVRLAVIALIGLKILDELFATFLTFAYKMGAFGVAQALGEQTPGDDYHRLIPLMDAIPLWLHGLMIVSAGLYLTALVLFALRKGTAYLFVLAALGVGILAQVVGRPIVAAAGVAANPHPSVLAAVVIPFVFPLALAAILWLAAREPGSLEPQP